MVKPFKFAPTPKILFRSNQISELDTVIKSYGSKIILVTGLNSFLGTKQAKTLLNKFDSDGFDYHLVKISGEPSPEMIDTAVKNLNDKSVNAVVAVGGGSVVDAGKAISAMLYKSESVSEYLEGIGGRIHPGTKIPFIAVPTTSGTGSEATKNAVISIVGKNGFKKSLRHDNFVPDIAIVDPELTISCPKNLTAATGMDCFTQLIEAYLSVISNEYTDALAFEGLKAVKSSLGQSIKNGDDIIARTGMSFAALTSGICLANAGLGIVHGFASSIGGMFNIPHGVLCGTLMASANKVNVSVLRKTGKANFSLKKYADIGKLFLGKERKTDEYYIDSFIQYLYELSEEFHLPGLRQFGLADKDLEEICSITENKNNPVKLTRENMIEIITGRL
jgi:alcohol dehydrogenase class IV